MNNTTFKPFETIENSLSFTGLNCIYILFENTTIEKASENLKLDKTVFVPMTIKEFGLEINPIDDNFKYVKMPFYRFAEHVMSLNENILYDITPFFTLYKNKNNYIEALYRIFNKYPEKLLPSYKKQFIYYIDMNTPFDKNIENRKINLIIQYLNRFHSLPVETSFLAIKNKDKIDYVQFWKQGTTHSENSIEYLTNVSKHLIYGLSEEDLKHNFRSSNIIEIIEKNLIKYIIDYNKYSERIRNIITYYLKHNEKDYKSILDFMNNNPKNILDLSATALLRMIRFFLIQSNSDNKYVLSDEKNSFQYKMEKINYLLSNIITDSDTEISKIDKLNLKFHHIVPYEKSIPVINDNLDISKILQKNQDEFKTLIDDMKDIINKTLSAKDYKMVVKDVKYEDVPIDDINIEKNEKQKIRLNLVDENNKKHKIEVFVPKLKEDGSFLINNIPRIILNQAILKPITVTEPYVARIQTLNTIINVELKYPKSDKSYFEIYLGGSKLPIFNLLVLHYKVEDIFKKFNLTYEIKDKPGHKLNTIKLFNKQFLIFNNIDKDRFKQLLFNSINKLNYDKYTPEQFFDNVIQKEIVTQYLKNKKVVSYLIKQLNEILDTITLSLLEMEKLPTEIMDIILYCCDKIKDGQFVNRNDMTQMRIRTSELITQLLNFEINRSYTEYQSQLISGNRNATIKINPDDFYSKVVNGLNASMVISEQLNPLEELSLRTRSTYVGLGTLPKKDAVPDKLRNLHPTMIGIIEPNDTPESSSMGAINNLALGTTINNTKGLLDINEDWKEKPASILSAMTSLIPFVNSIEGARVILASNQMKQVLNIKGKEPALVQTGFENMLSNNLSENFVKKSPINGKVIKITNDEIIVQNKTDTVKVNIEPKFLKGGSINSESIFTPIIKEGDTVYKDQLIANGACMKHGQITSGKNLLVAYMYYDGYSFEDGLVVSDRIIDDYSSNHVNIVDIMISKGSKILDVVNLNQPMDLGKSILRFVPENIEQVLNYDETIINKNFIDIKNQHENAFIRDVEIYPNDNLDNYPQLVNLFIKSKACKNINKDNFGKFKFEGEDFDGVLVRFYLSYNSPLRIGDKLTGRYGNKGIVSKIIPHNKMPQTPWGEHVDIILNPISIISRLNISQNYEVAMSQIAMKLTQIISEANDKKIVADLIKKVYNIIDKTPDKKMMNDLVDYINSLTNEQFIKFKENVKENNFPVVCPPFKSPTSEDIATVYKMLGIEFKYKLKLPEFNTETQNPVSVGWIYISKLEHISKNKFSARSVYTYSKKTMQPFSGKARGGGQKFGEPDFHALIDYNAKNVLNEFRTALSDDVSSKQKMMTNIITQGYTNMEEPSASPTKDLISAYFRAMNIEF